MGGWSFHSNRESSLRDAAAANSHAPRATRSVAWLAILTIPVVQAGLVASLVTWRLCPAEFVFAGLDPDPTITLSDLPTMALRNLRLLAPLLTLVVAAIGLRSARQRNAGRDYCQLLLGPGLVLATIWAAPVRGLSWLVVAMALVALAVNLWLLHPASGGPGRTILAATGWRAALRLLAWPTLIVVALVLVAGRTAGEVPDYPAMLLSLPTYPLYALVQLAIFLALPWSRWRRLGATPLLAALCSAMVFTLAHWPNPLAMAVTGLGLAAWAFVYHRTGNLLAVALSMGLLASVLTQAMPHAWTEHMRVGTRAIRERSAPALAEAARRSTTPAPGKGVTAGDLLGKLYPGVVGREATAEELQRWERSYIVARRGTVVWQFLSSPEYAGYDPEGMLTEHRLWIKLDGPSRERVQAHATPEYYAEAGGTWYDWLRVLYRDLLDREPRDDELHSWTTLPTGGQRKRLAWVLLDERRRLAHAPFDTLGVDDFALPR